MGLKLGLAAALLGLSALAAPALAAPVKCVALVHGAWVDASGWKPVTTFSRATATRSAWSRSR